MDLPIIRLKKNEDRRLRAGHLWIYSNEIDIKITPLKNFSAGEEVTVIANDKTVLGTAYVNPHSLISARLTSRRANDIFSQELMIRRIETALAWRDKMYAEPYYRLIFGESDNIPGLVVDRYNEHLVVQINTAGMEVKTKQIIKALQTVLPATKSILLRNDSPSRLQEGLTTFVVTGMGEPPEQVLVKENGVSFHAPITHGQKTGWFYDHRLNRSRLQEYLNQARVLDVFCYLGGWGIQAAVYGAREVVCLDSSEFAINAVKQNAELNNVAEKVKTIRDDAFTGLKSLVDSDEKFDVIILDPPAFIKKVKDKKEGMIAYQRINEMALQLLAPNGTLFSCSCSMHLSHDDFWQVLRRAGRQVKCQLQLVEQGHQAPDHPINLAVPETEYLKMMVVRRLGF